MEFSTFCRLSSTIQLIRLQFLLHFCGIPARFADVTNARIRKTPEVTVAVTTMSCHFQNCLVLAVSLGVMVCSPARADLPIHGPNYRPVKLSTQLVPVESTEVVEQQTTSGPSVLDRLRAFLPGFSTNKVELAIPAAGADQQFQFPTETTDAQASQSRLERLMSKVGLNRSSAADRSLEQELSTPVVQTQFTLDKSFSSGSESETPLPVVLPKIDEFKPLPVVERSSVNNR